MIERRHKAFTLIELMVAIAIIGIMTGVGFASLQSGRSESRLQAAQREVAATIKLARSHALHGITQSGVTPCGYGFRFDPGDAARQKYEIFFNMPGTSDCTAKNTDPNHRHYRNTGNLADRSQVAESFSLSEGVTLGDPNIYGGGNPNDAEIYFTVPHANVFDENGNPYLSQVFDFSFSGKIKSITINSAGTITEN